MMRIALSLNSAYTDTDFIAEAGMLKSMAWTSSSDGMIYAMDDVDFFIVKGIAHFKTRVKV
jgi:hypothetical protein